MLVNCFSFSHSLCERHWTVGPDRCAVPLVRCVMFYTGPECPISQCPVLSFTVFTFILHLFFLQLSVFFPFFVNTDCNNLGFPLIFLLPCCHCSIYRIIIDILSQVIMNFISFLNSSSVNRIESNMKCVNLKTFSGKCGQGAKN